MESPEEMPSGEAEALIEGLCAVCVQVRVWTGEAGGRLCGCPGE